MTWNPDFERAFHPRSIAIVGASSDSASKSKKFRPGSGFVGTIRKLGFTGNIYPVNPKATDVFGYKAYPSLLSLPEPVDLAIVAVPSTEVPAVLEDCVRAGDKNVHVYTAGFSETGTEEGKNLEGRVKEIAISGGLNILGPNCMGLTVPAARISTLHPLPLETGPVAFISQSGGHCTNFTRYARMYGIGFSKVISYGNGCLIDSTDLLEYFITDKETGIISMYLEGVKDGIKLFNQVKNINPRKPVIIWKGGLTDSGAKAAFSHTASMAGSEKIWDAFFEQTGAVRVSSVDELTDVVMTFLTLAPPAGRRAALFAGSGGSSVVAADMCACENIDVPTLTPETQRQFRDFVPASGTSINNPMDIEQIMRNPGLIPRVIELVSGDPQVDMVLVSHQLNRLKEVAAMPIAGIGDLMLNFARNKLKFKPMATVLETWEDDMEIIDDKFKLRMALVKAGMAAYDSIPRMCRAVNKYLNYLEFKVKSN